MPTSTKAKLAYQKAYNARPENVKKREKNNLARQHAIKAGKVSVGDPRDIGHLKPLEDGGTNAPSNLAVQSRELNRGWRKGKKGKGSYDPMPSK